jgi:hypothetical protein
MPAERRLARRERRARLWLSAAAIAGFLPALGAPLRHWLDFAAFYAGGRLAYHGDLLNPVAVVLLQASQGQAPTPFVSPPFLALAYVPLAALPYDLAAVVQVAVMAAALVGGAVLWADALGIPRRWAVLGALAWGPASASIASGQIDTLALLLTGLAVRLLGEGRRGLAGLVVALLAFKPQITVGAGIALLRPLGRRGVAALVAAGVALYALSAAAAGGDAAWPVRWIGTLQSYAGADMAANGWQASSPVSLGIRLAFATGSWLPLVAGVVVALAVAIVALRGWHPPSLAMDVALWSALGLVLSPHAWIYDATLLLPSLGAWTVAARRAGWPPMDVGLITAAYVAGALWPLGGLVGISLVPLVVMGVPLRLAWLLRGSSVSFGATGLLGHGAAGEPAGIVPNDSPH